MGREGQREGEKHQLVASHMSPTRDLVHNPSMCPDWESNQQPFGLQASAQPTEPHQSGQPYGGFRWTALNPCEQIAHGPWGSPVSKVMKAPGNKGCNRRSSHHRSTKDLMLPAQAAGLSKEDGRTCKK